MPDENALVSIIIPTYNRADLLNYTIDSVLYQSYNNIEIIVVDDASTDKTESVVESYSDDRVKFVRHSTNKGANAARNTGIDVCEGDYICFLDSDEILLPEKIKKQVAVFHKSEDQVGAVYCPSYSEFGGCLKNTSTDGIEGDIYTPLLSFNVKILTSQLLIKKECFEVCGRWDPDLPSFNEYDLCLRIAQEFKFGYVAEPLVVSRYHRGDQISRNKSNRLNGLDKIIGKWGDEMKTHIGESAPEEFRHRHLTRWYRAAALLEAQKNHRTASIKHASNYISKSETHDIKFIISFLCSLVHKRVYEIARKKWFCLTAEKKEGELEKYPITKRTLE